MPLSDTVGLRWASVATNQVNSQFNAVAASFYADLAMNPAAKDSLEFGSIRAAFALASLNGGSPLPVIVDLQGSGGFIFVVAYKATGNQIFIADPGSPGDASRFLQLGNGGTMIPYTNADAYGASVSLTDPVPMSLGVAVPLATLASQYPQAVAGTIGSDVFPASGFYSWAGQLYDTMYVVDSLRFWAQCATCHNGFATVLSPAPSANVAASINIYTLTGGLASDSIGGLSSNGLLVTNSISAGTQRTLGLPLASAGTANASSSDFSQKRWLDWHSFIITKLKGTVTLPAGGVLVNDQDTLSVSFDPNLLPADVAYQWTFGDGTPSSTIQNKDTVLHTFAASGNFAISVKVIDNRNTQVIARADTTLNGSNVELWRITSLTYLYTVVDGARSDTSPALVFDILPNTVPTIIALNGPPFPGGDYDVAGLAFASPPDSAQQWKQVTPIGLALAGAHPPIDVFAYSNTGTATSGTITGKAIQSTTGSGGLTNAGFTVNLTKNGTALSGYIMKQGTATLRGDASSQTTVVVDSVIAVRVP